MQSTPRDVPVFLLGILQVPYSPHLRHVLRSSSAKYSCHLQKTVISKCDQWTRLHSVLHHLSHNRRSNHVICHLYSLAVHRLPCLSRIGSAWTYGPGKAGQSLVLGQLGLTLRLSQCTYFEWNSSKMKYQLQTAHLCHMHYASTYT